MSEPSSELSQELRARVRDLLAQDPQGRLANGKVWAKALLLIAAVVVQYLILVFHPLQGIGLLAQLSVFALTAALVGFNVMHEAAHGNFSRTPWVNRAFGLSMDVFGVSFDLYRIKHTQFHHNYTNVYGLDGDISETPLLRMSPDQQHRGVHRFQHLYALPLYGLITLSWIANDFRRLVFRQVGSQTFARPSGKVVARILGLKLVHIGLAFVLPALLWPLLNVLMANLFFHIGLGTALAVIFQVAHVVDGVEFPKNEDRGEWFEHQIKTTADFAPESQIAAQAFGGLNFQVVHHIFPNVSYRHYPAIREIVQSAAAQHEIPYHEFRTLGDAVVSHFRFLKRIGSGA